MRLITRKCVLVIMAVSFLAMVTGVLLQLHLLGHDHHTEHHSDECSVCQNLLTTPEKFTQELETRLPGLNSFESYAEIPLHIYITTFYHNPFSPRAPPLV